MVRSEHSKQLDQHEAVVVAEPGLSAHCFSHAFPHLILDASLMGSLFVAAPALTVLLGLFGVRVGLSFRA
jgi:hypothetical protein